MLSLIGFGLLLRWKVQGDEEKEQKRINEALLKPRINVGRDFQGNMAVDTKGSVWQSAQVVDVQMLQDEILSLNGEVAKSGELAEPQKQTALENLAVVDEQLRRHPAERDSSKIERALKLLPGILSTVSALAKAWETLEPLIKAHLH